MSLLAALASIYVIGSVSDCSKGTALFTITSMSLSPDPPVKGQNSTLALSMTVPYDIQSGTAKYSVTYNFIPLAPTVEDLCTILPHHCPIKAGTLNTISSVPFDDSLKGTIIFKIEWKDTSNNELMCVSVNVKV
jgi:hypothetical protein